MPPCGKLYMLWKNVIQKISGHSFMKKKLLPRW